MSVLWVCVMLELRGSGQVVDSCTGDCSLGLETFPSLDSAFGTILISSSAHLYLTPVPSPFYISSQPSVHHSLSIQGNRQLIVLNSRITVKESGEMSIVNATIWMGTADLLSAFDIYGIAWLEDCFIEKFTIPLAFVSATLHLQRVNISHSKQTFLSVKGISALSLVQVLVQNHTGPFLLVSKPPTSLLVSECRFEKNSGEKPDSLLTFTFSASNLSQSVFIERTLFEGNTLLLLSLDIAQAVMTVTNCTFTGNSNGVIGGQVRGVLSVTSCGWLSNSGLAIDLRPLQGLLSLVNSSFTNQQEVGFIRVSGGSMNANCFISVSTTSFQNTSVSTKGPVPGVLWLEYCSSLLQFVSISNVLIRHEKEDLLKGLIYAFFGSIALESLQLSDSGSSGGLICASASNLSLSNSHIVSPYADVEVYIGGVLLQTVVRNTTFIGGKWRKGGPVYISTIAGSIQASDLSFRGAETTGTCLFGLLDCDAEITRINCTEILLYYALLMKGTHGIVRDFDAKNSQIKYRAVVLYESNLTITNAAFSSLYGLFAESFPLFRLSATKLILANTQIANMTLKSVISSTNGHISVVNATLINLSCSRLITNTRAVIELSNVQVLGVSTHELVLSVTGSISIDHSVVENVHSASVMLRLFAASVSLRNTVIRSWESRESLGRFEEESSLQMINCKVDKLRSSLMQGFVFASGNLSVRNLSVSDFALSLFQATKASVLIDESSFSSGGSTEKSLKSRFSFGGVLGCMDCWKVQISSTDIYNVSGQFGGAVALRNIIPSLPTAAIHQSNFHSCSARSGGAIYIVNASFAITHCSFQLNAASETGGALRADVAPNNDNLVSYSRFLWNQAKEGGAIKWRNEEIALLNVTFRENSADYGPNIASYGVRLSPQLLHFSGQEVSGEPLFLLFQLLDHYGCLVTTPSNSALSLLKTPAVAYRGNSIRFIHYGVFDFSPLTVYAEPGTTHVITAEMTDSTLSNHVKVQGSVHIPFRNCSSGEVYRLDRCEYCPSGYFSFHPTDSKCRLCPEHVNCAGGANFSVAAGHWRSRWDSEEVLECPLEGKCLGGLSSICEQGFTGKACSECAPRFFRYRFTECGDCGPKLSYWLRVALVVPLFLLFISSIRHLSLKHLDSGKLFLIKLLISHMQYLTALGFLRISLPSTVTSTIHAASYVASLLLSDLPLVCWGVQNSLYIRALLGSLILPMLGLLNGVVVWLTRGTWTQVAVLMTAEMLFTPVIVAFTTMPLLACFQLQGQWWLFADMQEQCWTPKHSAAVYAVALPSLILNTLLPIVILLTIMYSKKGRFRPFAPIWESGYKMICWDLALLLSRIAYTVILAGTVASNNLAQLAYGLCVLIIICVLNVGFQFEVYTHKGFFFLSQASLVVVAICHGVSANWLYSSHSDIDTLGWIYSTIFVVCNYCFCAVVLYFLFTSRSVQSYSKILTKPEVACPRVPHNSLNCSVLDPHPVL